MSDQTTFEREGGAGLPEHPLPSAPEVTAVTVEQNAAAQAVAEGAMAVETTSVASVTVELGTSHFREANAAVRAALEQANTVVLTEVFAQRYLGCAMKAGKRLEIHGTPGNDLACYMDGGSVEVFGSAQDQTANTMNAGSVVVHGRSGDATGYAMRGGELLIRDDAGWRAAINMKQYGNRRPVVVIGGDAGDFLGEYMAGGVVVLMGRPGSHLASGMHGGVVYLQRTHVPSNLPQGLVACDLDAADAKVLGGLLARYDRCFAGEVRPDGTVAAAAPLEAFVALRPASSRPYAALYAS